MLDLSRWWGHRWCLLLELLLIKVRLRHRRSHASSRTSLAEGIVFHKLVEFFSLFGSFALFFGPFLGLFELNLFLPFIQQVIILPLDLLRRLLPYI